MGAQNVCYKRVTLYKSLVRSKMDYCCPVWFPTTKEEISALEEIQRSFTSGIQSLEGLSYWEMYIIGNVYCIYNV